MSWYTGYYSYHSVINSHDNTMSWYTGYYSYHSVVNSSITTLCLGMQDILVIIVW